MGTEPPSLNRRAVVRVGAASAWTVPVVLVSAPAHATTCSPNGAAFRVTFGEVFNDFPNGQGGRLISFSVSVCSDGATALPGFVLGNPVGSTRFLAFAVDDNDPWLSSDSSGTTSATANALSEPPIAAGTCRGFQLDDTVVDGHPTDAFDLTVSAGCASATIPLSFHSS